MVILSAHPLARPLGAVWTRRLLTGAAAVLYLTETECRQLREVANAQVNLVELPNGVPVHPPRDECPFHPGRPRRGGGGGGARPDR